MAFATYLFILVAIIAFNGSITLTLAFELLNRHCFNLPTKKFIRRRLVICVPSFTVALLLLCCTIKTDLVEERIIESYTLIPFSDGEYYKKENGFLLFCHFSEPDEHFWLSTDLSSASDKTVAIEKIATSDISIEEVFSPNGDKKAFEVISQTTVQKAKLPFGVVLISNKPSEKELYQLRLATLDESLPKINISYSP